MKLLSTGIQRTLAIVLLASMATPTQADDATYKVRFPATGRVGHRYDVKLSAVQTLKQSVLQGAKVVASQENTVTIDFQATVEILEVNERKQETKRKYLVHRAVAKMGEQELVILPAETEVIAAAGEEGTEIERTDGKVLEQAAKNLLPQLIQFETGELTTDDVFGSDQPRTVGDQWEGNADALVKMLAQDNEEAKSGAVKSTAKLVAAKATDEGAMLDLVMQVEVDIPNMESPVPVADPVSATVVIEQRIRMLEGSTVGPIGQSSKITTKQILRGKAGSPVEGRLLDGTNIEIRKAVYTELPDAAAE